MVNSSKTVKSFFLDQLERMEEATNSYQREENVISVMPTPMEGNDHDLIMDEMVYGLFDDGPFFWQKSNKFNGLQASWLVKFCDEFDGKKDFKIDVNGLRSRIQAETDDNLLNRAQGMIAQDQVKIQDEMSLAPMAYGAIGGTIGLYIGYRIGVGSPLDQIDSLASLSLYLESVNEGVEHRDFFYGYESSYMK